MRENTCPSTNVLRAVLQTNRGVGPDQGHWNSQHLLHLPRRDRRETPQDPNSGRSHRHRRRQPRHGNTPQPRRSRTFEDMDRNEGPSSLETAQREAGSNHGHPILQTVGALGYANPREDLPVFTSAPLDRQHPTRIPLYSRRSRRRVSPRTEKEWTVLSLEVCQM